jgi:hypothetical protein
MEGLAQRLVRYNFDYEYDLAGLNPPLKKRSHVNREFQYLYFWTHRSDRLVVDRGESFDYQRFLLSFGLKYNVCEKKSVNNLSVINEWGKLENYQLERQINSKVYVEGLRRKLKIDDSPFYVLDSDLCISEVSFKNNWFSRPEFGFSGIGAGRIKSESDLAYALKKIGPKQRNVLTTYNEPLINFSAYISRENTYQYFKNLIVEGRYIGCDFLRDNPEALFPSSSVRDQYLEKQAEILEQLKSIGVTSSLGLDSYHGRNGSNYFHEINYRKSLSSVFFEIFQNNCAEPFGGAVILKTEKAIKIFGEKREIYDHPTRLLWISPKDRIFAVIIWSSKDLECKSWINSMLK